MTRQQLLKKYESLSASARRQVDALVTSLADGASGTPLHGGKRKRTNKVADEPFVGMWRDRLDMVDSTEWVRSLRRRQWSHRLG